MSSRALRRLQKEQEKEQQNQAIDADAEDGNSDDEEGPPVTKKMNAFDMLDAAEEEDEEDEEPEALHEESIASYDQSKNQSPTSASTEKPSSKKPKKKKSKKKAKAVEKNGKEATLTSKAGDSSLDEIDLALKSLATKAKDPRQASIVQSIGEANKQLYRLLAVESKHLNALNEMKRLFGNVVLENEESSSSPSRRRGRGPQQLDLGGALTARNSPVARGQGLSGPSLRRNFFIQGKEEWPKATGGGLGMELVEKMDDGTIEFRFTHNKIYQSTQRQFESCVESMDPQRMITMLVFNPYHVSTLLQVSEIAKQQGDHSVSGDLLERALFTFGRSVHSSFTAALAEGKARLDFRRPENREFWLAAWRYMSNLGQRGTWRTAYEWAKLILGLDPEGDPYCVAKIIDQLAIRGGQAQHFLDLSHCDFFKDDLWAERSNIAISSALAEYRLRKVQESRSSLIREVTRRPWVFARLFKELNIDRIPKAVWGTTPRSPAEKLDCEEYVYNAKDLWNTPEATTFLVETTDMASDAKPQPENKREVTLDDARYALLTGVPSIINCIPREFTNLPTSSSDPFPPPENLASYNPSLPPGQDSMSPGGNVDVDSDSPLDTASDGEPTSAQTDLTANPTMQHDESGGLIQTVLNRYFAWARTNPVRNPGSTDVAERNGDESERNASSSEPDDPWGVDEGQEDRPNPVDFLPLDHPLVEAILGSTAEDRAPSPQAYAPPEISTSASTPTPASPPNLQNYLAGSGLIALKTFTTTHGLDPSTWPSSPSLSQSTTAQAVSEGETKDGHALLRTYASRLLELPSERSRKFLLDYTIPQGGGPGVRDLVVAEMDRVKAEGG